MGGRRRGAPAFPIAEWDEWVDDRACADLDPNLFFPHPTEHAKAKKAKAICDGCPTQVECLEHAVAHNIEHGIWGGESERSRRRIRREMGLSTAGAGEDDALAAGSVLRF